MSSRDRAGNFSLLRFDDGRLRFRPDATRDVDLAVPLTKVERLDRSVAHGRVEPRGDRVYPAAGGVIHGTLTGIVGRRLAIDAHLVGPIKFDLQGIEGFVRKDVQQPTRSAADDAYELYHSAGSRLVGQVTFQPTGVKVWSPGLTAEVALRDVAAILFPVLKQPVSTTTCTLELMNGDEIVGVAPLLEDDGVVLGIGGGCSRGPTAPTRGRRPPISPRRSSRACPATGRCSPTLIPATPTNSRRG